MFGCDVNNASGSVHRPRKSLLCCFAGNTEPRRQKQIFTEYCMPAITQRHFDLSSPNQGCFSLHAVYLIFGRLSLSFITTLLLPARRSFVSFQRSSPGQTFIPLCQRVKEGKQAGSPGYVLTLEGCIQFCFLHCCVFAESTSQRKSDWQRARLKRCLAGQRICPLFPRDQGVFSSFFHVLLYARISVFHLIYIIFFGLFFNCHST